MKSSPRQYEMECKTNAVRLSEELGVNKAAMELGIPENTLYGWRMKHREEMKEWKRKAMQLEWEREILDKAARDLVSF